ncbi:MAG: histidinol-phosphatase HisJ family protein [Oscillospiraceae bacterium]|nr:histidinol-phosphatase HisJ family protein [Oscillospiraceae bacterium]
MPFRAVQSADLHLHTRFSPDSAEEMDSYCERAVARGIGALCFTDHEDFHESSLGVYDPEAYFAELERLREKYAGRLLLLSGLEFSEPHLHQKEFELARKRPYDFIMGSVHYWMGGIFTSEMLERGLELQTCWEEYWNHVLRMAEYGGFDCVGHLDFPKRYLPALPPEPERLDEIFAAMRRGGMVLELNSSSLRRGVSSEAMPGPALLERYIACGGKYVTLGSDAHEAGDFYADVPLLREQALAMGLEEVYFVQREMRVMKGASGGLSEDHKSLL